MEAEDNNGNTPFIIASCYKRSAILEYLLKLNANYEHTNKNEETAFDIVKWQKGYRKIENLLKYHMLKKSQNYSKSLVYKCEKRKIDEIIEENENEYGNVKAKRKIY